MSMVMISSNSLGHDWFFFYEKWNNVYQYQIYCWHGMFAPERTSASWCGFVGCARRSSCLPRSLSPKKKVSEKVLEELFKAGRRHVLQQAVKPRHPRVRTKEVGESGGFISNSECRKVEVDFIFVWLLVTFLQDKPMKYLSTFTPVVCYILLVTQRYLTFLCTVFVWRVRKTIPLYSNFRPALSHINTFFPREFYCQHKRGKYSAGFALY